MTYKNSRLKHVKKIMEMADKLSWTPDAVSANLLRDQCNLLLERKKGKMCKNCELTPGGVILVDKIDGGDVVCSACKRIVGPKRK